MEIFSCGLMGRFLHGAYIYLFYYRPMCFVFTFGFETLCWLYSTVGQQILHIKLYMKTLFLHYVGQHFRQRFSFCVSLPDSDKSRQLSVKNVARFKSAD